VEAIVFNETGKLEDVLTLKTVTINEPGFNEVQIKVVARPINPSDEMFVQGVYRQKPIIPQIAGLECAGIIEKCGQNVDASLLGKHAALRGRGTWAEKINIDVNNIRIIPGDITFEIACQLSLNTLTAYALLDVAGVSKNQWIAVTAANSSVSKQVIQMAHNRGINVIAIVRHNEQAEYLKSLGAKVVINGEKDNTTLKDFENQVNGCVDAVGGRIGGELFKLAAPYAKIILYGRLSTDPVIFYSGDVIYKNLQLLGFGIDAWLATKSKNKIELAWDTIISSIKGGSLKLSYHKLFPLKDYSQAIKAYKEKQGPVILVSE
jgi:NADPH:quinone reductase-like Zn-dependent oxidoreductase